MNYYSVKLSDKGTIAVDDTILVKGAQTAAGSRILEALMVAVCVAIGIGAGMGLSDMLGLSETLTLDFYLSVATVPEFLLAASSAGLAILGMCIYFDTPKKCFLACWLNASLSWGCI